MRLSANMGKVFRHMHESRYPMKTDIQSLVISTGNAFLLVI